VSGPPLAAVLAAALTGALAGALAGTLLPGAVARFGAHRRPVPGPVEPVTAARAVEPPPPVTEEQAIGPLVVGRPPSPVACRLLPVSSSATASFAAEAGAFDDIAVRVASCRGRSHMERAEALQDAYVVLAEPHGAWLVAAVADGVGGSPNGAEAARAAVLSVARRAPDWLAAHDPSGVASWRPLFAGVAGDVEGETRGLDGPRPLLGGDRPATTLAVLVAFGGGGDAHRVCCAAVGDTEVLRVSLAAPGGSRCWALLPEPDAGGDEGVSSLPRGVDQLRCAEIEWSSGVLLVASDGFAAALGPGNALEARLAGLWDQPPSPLELLRHVDFRLATYSDDRTVVALWRGINDQRLS
jgi:Protein phosphatase 2C